VDNGRRNGIESDGGNLVVEVPVNRQRLRLAFHRDAGSIRAGSSFATEPTLAPAAVISTLFAIASMEYAGSGLAGFTTLAVTACVSTTVGTAFFAGTGRGAIAVLANALGTSLPFRAISANPSTTVRPTIGIVAVRDAVPLFASTIAAVELRVASAATPSASVSTAFLSSAIRLTGTFQVLIAQAEHVPGYHKGCRRNLQLRAGPDRVDAAGEMNGYGGREAPGVDVVHADVRVFHRDVSNG